MGIDLYKSYSQADAIARYAGDLEDAKRKLTQYKSAISNNWKATEVTYYERAIDKASSEINSIQRDLRSLSSDIRQVAYDIWKAEQEAKKNKSS